MSRLAVIFWFLSILAGTQKILLQSREHRGSNLILMFLKHPPLLPASRFSIIPLNSRPKWSKNAKNQKIRYKSVITQKSVVKISWKILLISPTCVTVSLPESIDKSKTKIRRRKWLSLWGERKRHEINLDRHEKNFYWWPVTKPSGLE